jgi:hypothetical protein
MIEKEPASHCVRAIADARDASCESNYWSHGHHVAGEVLSGPGAAGIPCRGERFAAPRVFKWVVKKTPKFRDNLGQ